MNNDHTSPKQFKTDLSSARANEIARAVLGTDRAYVSKAGGGATLWLRNHDRALDGRFDGPLLAATGRTYRELVASAESGAIFGNAKQAIASLKAGQ